MAGGDGDDCGSSQFRGVRGQRPIGMNTAENANARQHRGLGGQTARHLGDAGSTAATTSTTAMPMRASRGEIGFCSGAVPRS